MQILPIEINEFGQPVVLIGTKAQEVIEHVWELSQGIEDNDLVWRE